MYVCMVLVRVTASARQCEESRAVSGVCEERGGRQVNLQDYQYTHTAKVESAGSRDAAKMASTQGQVKYDLDMDKEQGLMPLIRQLIKAPDEDKIALRKHQAGQTHQQHHPYYKRPGRGHNRDCCDSCQEGGDLLCCDRCPASFHLGCHDPPLEEDDIPAGQWICRECKKAGNKPRPISPTPSADSEKKSRSLRASRSNSSVSSASVSGASTVGGKVEMEVEEPKEPLPVEEPASPTTPIVRTPGSVLLMIAEAARILNPVQFALSGELHRTFTFPGTDDEKSVEKYPPHALDEDGCVPLPAKLCFHCRTSCRKAPLISCDYCPLLFHLDCLDPPLTVPPVGRWMCPNHVEQYVDWGLVNTISASERMALWDKFSGPIDQDAIRIDFIRKARRQNPLFRMKVPPIGVFDRKRVAVPPMVKYHYTKRCPLLPTRRDVVRCKKVLVRNFGIMNPLDYEEGDEKAIICLNHLCPKYLTKNSICQHAADVDTDEDDEARKQTEDAAEDLKAISEEVPEKTPKRRKTEPVESEDVKEEKTPKSKRKKNVEREEDVKDVDTEKRIEEQKISGVLDGNDENIDKIVEAVEERLKRFDARLVKLLAYQRLNDLIGWNNEDVDSKVTEMIENSVDKVKLSQYGFNYVPLPSELISREELQRIAKEFEGAVMDADELEKLRARSGPLQAPRISVQMPTVVPTAPAPSLSALPVKALLCHVERPARNGLGDGFGRPIPMRLSQLSIGTAGCDVHLQQYGNCKYVSSKHAIIFYDEITRHFELINYSEFGTCVNGQLYSCDFTEYHLEPSEPAALGGEGEAAAVPTAEEKAAALKAVAAKRRGKPPINTNSNITVVKSEKVCSCDLDDDDSQNLVAGWEGSALLNHGSLLQFGCIMFVFSIADAPLSQDC